MKSSQKVYSNHTNTAVLNRVPAEANFILDVGCGGGDNARELSATGMTVVGITLSEAEAELARKYCETVHLQNLENGLPALGSLRFDAVICSHVLEHICYPEKLLEDIHSILMPDGKLIVALPNIMHYRTRIMLALGRFDYQDYGTLDYTHFRWYTHRTGRELLTKHGFNVLEATATGSLPFGRLRRRFLGSFSARYDDLAGHCFPGLLGHQLIYVAKRK